MDGYKVDGISEWIIGWISEWIIGWMNGWINNENVKMPNYGYYSHASIFRTGIKFGQWKCKNGD